MPSQRRMKNEKHQPYLATHKDMWWIQILHWLAPPKSERHPAVNIILFVEVELDFILRGENAVYCTQCTTDFFTWFLLPCNFTILLCSEYYVWLNDFTLLTEVQICPKGKWRERENKNKKKEKTELELCLSLLGVNETEICKVKGKERKQESMKRQAKVVAIDFPFSSMLSSFCMHAIYFCSASWIINIVSFLEFVWNFGFSWGLELRCL